MADSSQPSVFLIRQTDDAGKTTGFVVAEQSFLISADASSPGVTEMIAGMEKLFTGTTLAAVPFPGEKSTTGHAMVMFASGKP
jgi:hypothetical protein